MKIISDPKLLKKELSKNGQSEIGFVPTMGALHKGHLSLIQKSRRETDLTVVSIFVNPTQFNDPKDLKNYPNTIKKDIDQLKILGVDYLFTPKYEDLYKDDYRYRISENQFSKELCGKSREGHFAGVMTVVMKLLNIVKPAKAYFGEKDYQQFKLIKDMVKAFYMDVEIISSPTVRDSDGLALSSRNQLLTIEEREKASIFPQVLNSKQTDEQVIETLTAEGFKVDYVETNNERRFGAVFLGNVRWIDNVKIKTFD